MAFVKYLVPVLSVAATAYAASCSTTSTFTVQNQGDATSVSSCQKFSGDIEIAKGAGAAIDFTGSLEQITGSLIYAGDDAVQSLKADSLTQLGSLNLTNLAGLSTLTMTKLTTVGDMSLSGLNTLGGFDFSVLDDIGSLSIVNTQIQSLGALSKASKIGDIELSDNTFLGDISFELEQLDPLSSTIEIGVNNFINGQTIELPNLVTAGSITIRNATSISTPALSNVSDTLGLYSTTMQSYSAPNLTLAGGIVVNDNSQLTNLSFPVLVGVNISGNSTLQVANNTKLLQVDGFPQLVMVKGDVDMSGSMDNITLPKIHEIDGALNVQTTSTHDVCTSLNKLSSEGAQVVRGKTNCHSENTTAPTGTGGGDDGGDGTSSSPDGSTTSNAAVLLDVPAWVTGAGLFGGLFALLL